MEAAISAYYNEIDPLKAEVLREAIKAGAIAPGDVDERSIEDVQPSDLVRYTQCHFFAGGGFWSLALRYAGWPDDRPVWTGSCPCPSFSAAGKGAGFDDPRHLWPSWEKLIRQSKPPVVFGEQADDAVGFGWLDLIQANLEASSYAVGKVVFGAASVGAPHIRQRIYFVADTQHAERRSEQQEHGYSHRRNGPRRGCDSGECDISDSNGRFARRQTCPPVGYGSSVDAASGSGFSTDADGGQSSNGGLQRSWQLGLLPQDCGTGMYSDTAKGGRGAQLDNYDGRQFDNGGNGATLGSSDALHTKRWPLDVDGNDGRDGEDIGRQEALGESGTRSEVFRSGDSTELCERPWDRKSRQSDGQQIETGGPSVSDNGSDAWESGLEGLAGDVRNWRGPGWLDPHTARSVAEAGATRGFWADCDWWYGRDDKYRPIGPGLFPLAHGSAARVGRLRLFGDGIVVTAAQAFIEAYLEATED